MQIVNEFLAESNKLLKELFQVLDECEMDFSKVKRLEHYGQLVDRVMGGALTVGLSLDDKEVELRKIFDRVGDCAGICKAVGYKAAAIQGNEHLYDICVAFLQDATELLQSQIDILGSPQDKSKLIQFEQAFVDRLKWLSSQFNEKTRGSVGVHSKKMSQEDIDELIKKLGLD